MKKILYALSIITVGFGLSACNTFEGAGKDIEKGGEYIQNASKNVKERM